MDIVVLAGGTSTERDVSLVTGAKVYYALKNKGHHVVLVDVYLGYGEEGDSLSDIFAWDKDWAADIRSIAENAPDLSGLAALRKDGGRTAFGPNVLKICQMADIVFMGLHGQGGEDGRIQAAFDLMDIKYTGTDYISSAMAMDKGVTKQLMLQNHIPTPAGILLKKNQDGTHQTVDPASVPYPCMVKTVCGGSSVGAYRVNSAEELPGAVEDAFSYAADVIVEQYICGREFSVGVIDGKALPIIEIAPLLGFYDYKNKYQAGSTIETCPAKLDADLTLKMQHYAEEVYRVLGMKSYARMDFMMDTADNGIYCLEANTLPGMTPTSLLPQEAAAIGVGFEDLCEWIIRVSMEKYR